MAKSKHVERFHAVYDVTLRRAVDLTMAVGIEATSPEDAQRKALELAKVNRDAGWRIGELGKPEVESVGEAREVTSLTGR